MGAAGIVGCVATAPAGGQGLASAARGQGRYAKVSFATALQFWWLQGVGAAPARGQGHGAQASLQLWQLQGAGAVLACGVPYHAPRAAQKPSAPLAYLASPAAEPWGGTGARTIGTECPGTSEEPSARKFRDFLAFAAGEARVPGQ